MVLPLSAALVVLAGGRAARLQGLVKPLLVRSDGRTLLAHLLEALAPLVEETVIVAPAAIAGLFPGRVIEDPGRGPGIALITAARALSQPRILAAAGDLVTPSPALGAHLLASPHPAAVVSKDGVLQPAFAAYSTAPLAGLASRDDLPPGGASGRLSSLRACLSALGAFVIDAGDLAPEMLHAFDDVDTPADVVRALLSTAGVPTWPHLAADAQ